MKWKKIVALGCVAVMAAASVTACGGGKTGEAVQDGVAVQDSMASTEERPEEESASVIVRVTAVDGNAVTAEVGTLSSQNMGEKPGEAAGGEPGEKPEGEPGGMPGGSSFESAGETVTFTLTEDTVVTLEYLQGSSEGSILFRGGRKHHFPVWRSVLCDQYGL